MSSQKEKKEILLVDDDADFVESTKTVGLVNALIREQRRPRCDVFWNNELLGTLSLARHGILEPYQGPGYQRIPAGFKAPYGYWTGFGARFRVYIVNTGAMAASERGEDMPAGLQAAGPGSAGRALAVGTAFTEALGVQAGLAGFRAGHGAVGGTRLVGLGALVAATGEQGQAQHQDRGACNSGHIRWLS